MELSELQKEAHAISRNDGWYDTERTFGDFVALIHSELSKALEAQGQLNRRLPMELEQAAEGL